MSRLVSIALRRPRAVLALWMVAAVALGVVGIGVHDRLAPSTLNVPGSEAAQARKLLNGQFGDSASVPILLTGPARAVTSQGRALSERLAGEPGVTVVSPWSGATRRATLRPKPDTALIVASVAGDADTIDRRAGSVERIARAAVTGPVHARVSGLPILARAGIDASAHAVHRAELIALPVLLLILLLVFRSPVAAAVPVVFGAATVAASYGVLSLLAGPLPIDPFATALATMMGLALAVDYSLLMVARFREERGAGRDRAAAAAAAATRTGHTVLVAGLAVVVAMIAAAVLSPSPSILSAAVGVTAVTVLSVAGASLAVPAALVLLAGKLVGAPGGERPTAAKHVAALRALRHPLVAATAALGLALLAVPAFGLSSGALGSGDLPPGSTARQDAEAIAQAMGPGWGASFELVAVAEKDPITTAKRLSAFARLERRLARDPRVAAVIGPGSMAADAARLRSAGRRAVTPPRALSGQARGLRRLGHGVDGTASGVASLRGALGAATAAAGRIDSGSGNVAGGVGQLRNGLRSAAGGAESLSRRLSGARNGTRAVTAGAASARDGAARLSSALRQAGQGVAQLAPKARSLADGLRGRRSSIDAAAGAARAQRQALYAALDQIQRSLPPTYSSVPAAAAVARARKTLNGTDVAGSLDPIARQLGDDAAGAAGVADALTRADVASLRAAADRLAAGIGALETKLKSLGVGVEDLAGGTGALMASLRRLGVGTDRLGAGVDRLRAGVGGLLSGVRDGERRTSALAQGVDEARRAVAGLQTAGAAARRTPTSRPAPGFFDSGYFVLAALQSAGNGSAGFGVNVDRGGQAARVLIVPRYGADDPRTRALFERLADTAHGFGRFTGTQAAVGGPAALLIDHDRATMSRFPQLVLVLTLLTALLIGVLLRSLVVPVIGAALNLLTVGATLGLLSWLFQGDAPLLGGPGALDAVALTAVFGVIFALSLDYQVFIVARIREEFLRSGDARAAVDRGLARTARVVTGAALSMFGVFLAFALADVASVRQFGVGLAIAIALDATVVRLVLLPAALRLAGRHAWSGTAPARAPSVADRGVQFSSA